MDNFKKKTGRPNLEYTPIRPHWTGSSKSDVSNYIFGNMKASMTDVPAQTAAGSTLPLVGMPRDDEEAGSYNPFENRKLTHPTTDTDTLVHLLKGSLGSGILAMPLAFLNAGLWFGLGATVAIGVICTYCVHILVKCAHLLCRRAQVPSLGFADVAETAFLAGPDGIKKYSRLARFIINMFLVLDLLGCCCIYIVFVATNVKQVVDYYTHSHLDVRYYIVLTLVPLILVNLIRELKYLTPFSAIANILIGTGVGITLYYILQDLPEFSDRKAIAEVQHMPMFFGTVIFALEGIGVVMSLENNMKTPQHFIGCPGVLNIGMSVVVTLYACVGFLGYLKYGEDTKGSVTLNLPVEDILAQAVKLMIAVAIFLTYTLQFYVPMEIIWKNVKHNFNEHKNAAEYSIRIGLVVLTVAIAAALPNLGPFITLIGAVCLSTLGLMFPAVIEMVTYYEKPGYGRFNWVLWKNIFLILFGVIGFVTGTYVSILEFSEHLEEV
ncbi:proton-coupled amino acid transporter-like protein pathetic isoform X2 [Toxorhynchites rutilus septentrionalis]|uniref:proton-coupled amino acid transporter-like protein pathetic isoform X2 n=1 Tax=Toxorhynchites rutilus septentrionalis TaxID=329112 RepID=UPI00247938A7|nr:proton-coupled amino acid transporter-like protein pathetic isoform X2 [Toxorhynchites rutilus septentrionalis]